MANFRLVCRSCGVKWFVPSGVPVPADTPRCEACGGELAPLRPEASEPPPVWDPLADL